MIQSTCGGIPKKTLQKIQHNRSDTVVWKIKEKLCFIIDVSIGLDVNVDKNYELKHSSYLPLAAELKRLYKDYKFEVVPIVVGATGLVTNILAKSLEKLGVSNIKATVKSCQKKALLGTLKILWECKFKIYIFAHVAQSDFDNVMILTQDHNVASMQK